MSNWISLKESQPEVGLQVLFMGNGLMAVALFCRGEIYPANVESYDNVDLSFDPTHWQPLPSAQL